MLLDGLKADGIDIFDSFGKSVGGYIVRSSSLEFKGQALEGGLLPRYLINHLTTTLIGRQLLQPLLLAIQHANASRSVHLMSAEGKEVAVHRLNIHLEVGCTLSTIHQHRDSMFMGRLDNLLYRINRPKHITYMRYAHQLRLG